MATIILPFSIENKVDDHDTGLFDSELYKRLPLELQKTAESSPHLLEYLHMLPTSHKKLSFDFKAKPLPSG